ncbi:MAG: sensor domain-containing diguanylate cyclase [Azoarcus sp.]|nr:MAG: sensor domain-containing diguanylate cyclase [Azoarcus sp.]
MPFRNSSIRTRLLLASTAVQVVLLSLLLANSVRLMNDATTASLDTLISQNASMLHAMATAYGEQPSYGPLQDTLGELLADSDKGLIYVRIGDSTGRILLSAGQTGMSGLPPATATPGIGIGEMLDHPVIHVRRPLLLARNEVGFLQFGVSVSVLAKARQSIIQQGALIALIEIVITFVLLSGIGYLLSNKLARLLAGSKAITDGYLDHRLPDDGGDELARLAKHFNIMASTLQQRVSELQQTAERLKTSEQRYALAMRGANDGLWDWDINTNRTYFAPRFCELIGIPEDDAATDPEPFISRLHPDETAGYRARMIDHLRGDNPQFMLEHRIRQPDGSYRWIMTRGVALRDASGRAIRMAGSISDVHLRKRAEEQLIHDALHDGLTGLPNRALFIEHVRLALGQQRRDESYRFAVLAINLERFHLVNDSYGHATGDLLLREVAHQLHDLLRSGDLLARVGGDQFAVLLNGVDDSTEALDIAKTMIELPGFDAPGADRTLHPKCRIGLAMSDNERTDGEALLRAADNALQIARQSDNCSIKVFHASMHALALNTLQLETDLRNALASGTLSVHYQPIMRLMDRRISSFEALVRWEHPVHGMIPPSQFIPLAEALDMIHELGLLVLRRTCEDILRWQAQTGNEQIPPVSVNLSARQLSRSTLADELIAIIEASKLEPERIRFEVTESILARADGPASNTLRQLRSAGIKVLIDDFGTGFSALSYLHTIPCDLIKLDGSFVGAITNDSRLRAIVRRSIELAHDLNIGVVAECIESGEQATTLNGMGCDFGQGYLFSRPLPAEEASRFLTPVSKETQP